MKTRFANPPSLPSLGTTLLIAGIFVIPLLIWGDRWPWLVALPIGVMVFLTIRSEWLRIRALDEKTNVQIMQATLVPEAPSAQAVWYVDDKWINIVASGSSDICNITSIDDYDTSRQMVDEKLTAVA